MSLITRTFADIDLSFEPNPTSGDIGAKYDDNAIKNAVKNLILTQHFERPFHSEIGSNIYQLLFDIPSPSTTVLLRQEIINAIENFDPRVNVDDVSVQYSYDANSVAITIIFTIVNTTRPFTIQFTLNRTR